MIGLRMLRTKASSPASAAFSTRPEKTMPLNLMEIFAVDQNLPILCQAVLRACILNFFSAENPSL